MWKGRSTPSHDDAAADAAEKAKDEELHTTVMQRQQELHALHEEEVQLDRHIEEVTAAAAAKLEANDATVNRMAYVCAEDLRAIPGYKDQTIIVVRAKKGTTLEVPDPDEGALMGFTFTPSRLCARLKRVESQQQFRRSVSV